VPKDDSELIAKDQRETRIPSGNRKSARGWFVSAAVNLIGRVPTMNDAQGRFPKVTVTSTPVVPRLTIRIHQFAAQNAIQREHAEEATKPIGELLGSMAETTR